MQFSANFRFSFRHSLSCLIIVETAGALGLTVPPSLLARQAVGSATSVLCDRLNYRSKNCER